MKYRDAARLLAYYRYWADDLFKKGRFRDTCAIIEKLGHTRAVKLQREAWISEAAYGQMNPGEMDRETEDDIRRQHERPVRESGNGQTGQEEDNDDDLYSVPNRTNVPSAAGNGAGTTSAAPQKQWQQDDPNSLFKGGFPDSDDDLMMDDDDDFDLDALLAEQRSNGKLVAATTNNTMAPVPVATSKPLPKTGSHNGPPPPDEYDGPPPPDEEDDFEAEMEALRDLGPPDE